MRRPFLTASAVVIGSSVGCVEHVHRRPPPPPPAERVVYVETAPPPPPPVEYIAPAPGPEYIYVGPRYVHERGYWVLHHGYYDHRHY